MPELSAIIDRYFPSPSDDLLIGGVGVSRLAAEYDTPFFVYDSSIMNQKWNALRGALPALVSIYYSIKANPLQTVIKNFLAKGAGLEIASAGEFCQATRAGCPPGSIVFAGPGKSERELELVLSRGIGEIHLESLREGQRVNKIAQRLGKAAPVALRVNPGGDVEGGAMRMGGRSAAFGIDEEDVPEVLSQLSLLPGLHIQGVHLFTGTQILDFQILVNQYRKGLEIASSIAERLGRPLHTVDFGGGLGVPYFTHESELDTGRLKDALATLFEPIQKDPLFSGTRFLIEPGRYLVADSGLYVARVNDIKLSRGKKFVILDGGMNHHLAASGNLGQAIKRNYPIAAINKLTWPAKETVEIAGPLCTPLDVLGRGARLASPEVGDLIGIFQSGAYGRSASPLGFLSHPTPPEVWVENGHHRLVRHRGEFEDYLRDQIPDSRSFSP
jgi:diaminopimelate decarboxylase